MSKTDLANARQVVILMKPCCAGSAMHMKKQLGGIRGIRLFNPGKYTKAEISDLMQDLSYHLPA